MLNARSAFVFLFSLALASPLAAQESGNFVVRLGNDTTGVEHYTRTASRLEITQVGRSPRVLQRHLVYDFDASGAITGLAVTVTNPSAPAGAPAFQQIDVSFTPDSALVSIRRDTVVTHANSGFSPGAVLLAISSPWSLYERQTMKFAGQKADSLHTAMYYLGGNSANWITVGKLGRDSVTISSQTELYHARVDKQGHLLSVVPLHGTQRFGIDRVDNLDLAGTTASFLAREKQAGAMGALSTRDTARADNAGGASLWIDYGRPAKRGRVIFGGIVAWNELWRLGANAATQFKTDKPLMMGTQLVPAGFYSLWTIPAPDGWKLVINSETGEWGTEHKGALDLYSIDMKTSALPASVERFTISIDPNAQGGVINFDWDATRASLPFTVKQP